MNCTKALEEQIRLFRVPDHRDIPGNEDMMLLIVSNDPMGTTQTRGYCRAY